MYFTLCLDDTGTNSATDEMSSASASYQPRLTLTSLISNPNDASTTYIGSKSDQPKDSLTSPTKSLTEDTSAAYSASASNQPTSRALTFPLPDDTTANTVSGLSSSYMASHNQSTPEASTVSGPSSTINTTQKTILTTTPVTTVIASTLTSSNTTVTTVSANTTPSTTTAFDTTTPTTTRPPTTTTTTPHASTAGAMMSCVMFYLIFASFVLLDNSNQL